jgi:hypothetical protein
MSARAITAALGGRWHGTYGMAKCCCHDDGKTPALQIKDDPRKNDGIDVNCYAHCDWRDVKAELRRRGLLGEFQPEQRRRIPVAQLAPPEPEPDAEALEIWRAGIDIADTLGERYLRTHRGLTGPFPASLRFIPSIRHPALGMPFPALVAAVQRPDRRIIAVQVTFLRPTDGAKGIMSVPRLTFGKLGSGMVRLAHAGEQLGIAEGIETALAAMELTGVPVWATLGGKRLSKVKTPTGVRHVHIFADNDTPGRAEAEKAAVRFTRGGLRVSLRFPPDEFGDYNDMLRAQEGRAAA